MLIRWHSYWNVKNFTNTKYWKLTFFLHIEIVGNKSFRKLFFGQLEAVIAILESVPIVLEKACNPARPTRHIIQFESTIGDNDC